MATSITDLWTRVPLSDLKSAILSIAQGAGLPTTSWKLGGISERFIEISARVMDQFLGAITADSVKGFFLDQATDPGDPGNPNTTEGPGWLSALGEGWYGTVRRGASFAAGTVTITNGGASTVFPKPGEIQVERSTTAGDGGKPTYTTTTDDTIYTNPDGSVSIAPGASVDLPIRADVAGSYSDASGGQITIVVTGTFDALTCTNAGAVVSTSRESASDYRARCRRASSRVATGDPTALIEYASNTDKDGNPLQRHDDTGDVQIARVWVDDAQTEAGSIRVYLAGSSGTALGVDTVDKESADANITGIPRGIITDPIGVVHGSEDYSTNLATTTTIAVAGTAKISTADAGGLTALEIQTKVTNALALYFSTFPIGGLDKVSGAGVMHTGDLLGVVKDAFPGLYAPMLSAPATSTTAITLGHVAVVDSDPTTDFVVTIV